MHVQAEACQGYAVTTAPPAVLVLFGVELDMCVSMGRHLVPLKLIKAGQRREDARRMTL